MIKRFINQMEPSFDSAEVRALTDYFKQGGWGGEYIFTEALEKKLAGFTGAKYCSMTSNGTVSLIIALIALGLKTGDEILIPDMTMIASPNAAAILGIKPILVDVEEQSLCLDLIKAEPQLTKKTKALMYVPFNGRSGNMKQVVDFCRRHRLWLIEDSAQALGSYWQGKHLGTFGDIGSFSFSVPKIITTGQGGALITNNRRLYQKIEKIKDFGRIRGGVDVHNDWGWNFKFSDFLAVIGIEQMKKLPARIKRKRQIYRRYYSNLKSVKQILFVPTDLNQTTPWFIDIYVNSPGKLSQYLFSKGIGSRPIYPAIHTQKIYRSEYQNIKFPVATRAGRQGLWLPSSITLTDAQIDRVTNTIKRYYRQ